MTAPVDGMTADARAAVDELLTLRGQPIVLIPAKGVVVEKPGGGKDYGSGAPRAAQVFAKFNTHALDGVDDAKSDRGTVRRYQFDLIGAFGAVVQTGDTWEDFAATYVVDSVDVTQPYQVKASVTAFLKVPEPGG